MLLLADLYHTICFLLPTRRRTKQNSKVSPHQLLLSHLKTRLIVALFPHPEAALDANAPIEDEDDANNGPVDSDEETSAVMGALATWKPQPVIPQPTFAPIKRQYQLARLHEQLQMATNGGRTNIFAVSGFGAQKLPEGHPGLQESEDAPGELDLGVVGFGARTTATFTPQRQASVSSRA